VLAITPLTLDSVVDPLVESSSPGRAGIEGVRLVVPAARMFMLLNGMPFKQQRHLIVAAAMDFMVCHKLPLDPPTSPP